MKKTNIKQIVLCGFAMAIIFVLTAFVAVPIGQFGYVNLGDSGVMLFASILNPSLAFLCGGLGSALADLYLGYSQYALFTFLVKGIEGIIVSLCFKYINNKMSYFGYLLAIVMMVFGYYLTDALLYGDFIVALGGVGFNFMQGLVSCVATCLLSNFFVKIATKYL